ncbi:MAG: UDP-N-acetylmuramoyl-L-alanyl-D-glutamate--2,6-diaminopimelate ligase [Clostridiales bacterium]|nr:UDP-N-acetylmuramoyl-L-alanyl-D-glutamate--2,6-diaminopimelate ligase [Clostridiales bacterium]
MKLEKLLKTIDIEEFYGDREINISGIAYDSRKVKKGYLFVCIDGIDEDGHEYLTKALKNGAVCALITKKVSLQFENYIRVLDGRIALAKLANCFYDNPSQKMKVTGITGTKGKTTIAKMIKTIMEYSNIPTSSSGTLGMFIGNTHIKTINTTPSSLDLQQFFSKSLSNKINHAVIEVASIALKQKRVQMIDFDIGIYTNLARTHIGKREHDDFEDYLESKAKLFNLCKIAIYNIDDPYYMRMMDEKSAKPLTYSVNSKQANIYATKIHKEGVYTTFTYNGLDKVIKVTYTLPGQFNISNAIAAITASLLMGATSEGVINGLAKTTVKGRCEVLDTNTPYMVMIDYAHNQSSLLKLLTEIKEDVKGKMIVLFGCGGDRDNAMRYEMGEIAGNNADYSIITTDNPRTEEPIAIINMIEEGIKKTNGKYIKIVDRTQAIKHALTIGKENDLVILAGKGHETYIEKNHVRSHYDEREIVNNLLKEIL